MKQIKLSIANLFNCLIRRDHRKYIPFLFYIPLFIAALLIIAKVEALKVSTGESMDKQNVVHT